MKNEIPISTIIAPSAIAIALPLLRLLDPDPAVVLLTTAGGLVVVVGTGDSGVTPPDRGLVVAV
jgi:hypothetical protein